MVSSVNQMETVPKRAVSARKSCSERAAAEARVAQLRATIVAFFQKDLTEDTLFLPWSEQQLRGEIYANCQVLEESADENGALFRIRADTEAIKALREKLGEA